MDSPRPREIEDGQIQITRKTKNKKSWALQMESDALTLRRAGCMKVLYSDHGALRRAQAAILDALFLASAWFVCRSRLLGGSSRKRRNAAKRNAIVAPLG
jgi:hypothetical protein